MSLNGAWWGFETIPNSLHHRNSWKKHPEWSLAKGYGSVRPTKSQILVFLFASTRPQMSAGPRQIHVPGSSSGSHHPFPRGSLRPHGVDGSCRDAQPQAQRSGTEWNCRWRGAKGHIQCWWLWKAQDKPRVARYDCWCMIYYLFFFIIKDSPNQSYGVTNLANMRPGHFWTNFSINQKPKNDQQSWLTCKITIL